MKLDYEISESIWRDLISALYIESLLINWRSNVFWFLYLLILIQDKSKSGDNFVLEFSWLLDHDRGTNNLIRAKWKSSFQKKERIWFSGLPKS